MRGRPPVREGSGCLTMWTWAELIADFFVIRLAGLTADRGFGSALHFFIYDLLKITVLILAVSFIMRLVRQALPLEKLRGWLERPGARAFGYPAAALFGALTPFCSCSSVPIFLGLCRRVSRSASPSPSSSPRRWSTRSRSC
jgi:uncharacterized membrane protein YraQ (UPF0718 family)